MMDVDHFDAPLFDEPLVLTRGDKTRTRPMWSLDKIKPEFPENQLELTRRLGTRNHDLLIPRIAAFDPEYDTLMKISEQSFTEEEIRIIDINAWNRIQSIPVRVIVSILQADIHHRNSLHSSKNYISRLQVIIDPYILKRHDAFLKAKLDKEKLENDEDWEKRYWMRYAIWNNERKYQDFCVEPNKNLEEIWFYVDKLFLCGLKEAQQKGVVIPTSLINIWMHKGLGSMSRMIEHTSISQIIKADGNISGIAPRVRRFADELIPGSKLDPFLKLQLRQHPHASIFAVWASVEKDNPNGVILNQLRCSWYQFFLKEIAKHHKVSEDLGFETLPRSFCWIAIENSATVNELTDLDDLKKEDSLNDTLFSVILSATGKQMKAIPQTTCTEIYSFPNFFPSNRFPSGIDFVRYLVTQFQSQHTGQIKLGPIWNKIPG